MAALSLQANPIAQQLTATSTGQKPDQSQDGKEPTPDNFTMLQGFEWYVPDDKNHWKRLKAALPGLKATGVDNICLSICSHRCSRLRGSRDTSCLQS